MYKSILLVLGLSTSLFLISCSDNDTPQDVTVCANTLMNETNCYLEYIKLDDEAKTCCDTWIEENKE